MSALVEKLHPKEVGQYPAVFTNKTNLKATILRMDLPSTFNLKGYVIQTRRNEDGKVLGDEVPLFLEFHQGIIKATNLFDATGTTPYQDISHDHIAQLALSSGLMQGGKVQGVYGDGISIRYFDDNDSETTDWKPGILIPQT